MFSSPIFYLWLVWLLAVAVIALIRHKTRRRDELQRAERRRQREVEREVRPARGERSHERQSATPAGYRDQLIAAGLIRPAAEPDATTDPKIGCDPKIAPDPNVGSDAVTTM